MYPKCHLDVFDNHLTPPVAYFREIVAAASILCDTSDFGTE